MEHFEEIPGKYLATQLQIILDRNELTWKLYQVPVEIVHICEPVKCLSSRCKGKFQAALPV